MKFTLRLSLALCLLLLAAGPAMAELRVEIINRTDFELQAVYLKGDEDGMGSSVKVVPGNSCVVTYNSSTQLEEAKIDAGLMIFSFTNMDAVAGMSNLTFELTFDADDRPHLTLVDEPAQAGGAGDSFDLPAGPIWDNAHAQKRCPEVLEEWLEANPGKQAEWNGNWATVTEGEESVCGITITGAVPSLINVVGTVTVLADPSTTAQTNFDDIINAGSMGDILSMGAQQIKLVGTQVYIPATFAGKTWAVFVEPEDAFDTSAEAKPGVCHMRTYLAEVAELPSFMKSFAEMGYRPWYAQLNSGENMELDSAVRFWNEDMSAEEAWEQLVDACTDIKSDIISSAVDMILIPEGVYDKAAHGENPQVPGFRVRVSNSVMATVIYMPDISTFVSMPR